MVAADCVYDLVVVDFLDHFVVAYFDHLAVLDY